MVFDFSASTPITQLTQAFIAGLGTSFTPCVYPLIPITLSVIGARAARSRREAFTVSAAYVFGICCTYTVLGMASAYTGALFGSALGNPYVVFALSLLLFLLACSSLDLFSSQSLSKLQNAASKWGGSGLRGAFVMGTVSGLVAAPCVGPVLVLILGVAATSGQTLWGALLLFVYSLGFGSIFLLLGAFPQLLNKLPRSGNWLIAVKIIIAAALLTALLFIAERFTLGQISPALLSRDQLIICGAFGALLSTYLLLKTSAKSLRLCIALSLALFISPFAFFHPLPTNHALVWRTSIEEVLALIPTAKRSHHAVAMIDFSADWCAACKELEAKTFQDPAVITELQKLLLARIDFTEPDEVLSERYNIQGLPAVLFLDAEGKEIPNSRVSGFMGPEEFLAHIAPLID